MSDLFECIAANWAIGIGDPYAMGWVTVGLYLLAAVAALAVGLKGRFPLHSRGRERAFWLLAAVLLAALGVNKQLDLQSLMTAAGRCVAQLQGWYEDRRAVQTAFVLGVAVVAVLALLVAVLGLRRATARTRVAMFGLCFVSAFVVIRAAGLHGFDALINSWVAGVRVNWALELPGPALVLAAAVAPHRGESS